MFDGLLQAALSAAGTIDIHCHSAAADEGGAIVSFDTLDYDPAAAYGRSYTLGIHPWFIARQNCEEALHKIAKACDDPYLLAIGECGLDNSIATPLSLQESVFRAQIDIAEQCRKPVIIHAVRSFNELLRIRKNAKARQPWIIHGFNGNSDIAGQLLKQGCYLSFGKALLQENSRASRVLAAVSPERWFLETDAAEDVSIGEIYAAAAKILGLDVKSLQHQIITNFKRVFPHD